MVVAAERTTRGRTSNEDFFTDDCPTVLNNKNVD